jgi:hypothetical protein
VKDEGRCRTNPAKNQGFSSLTPEIVARLPSPRRIPDWLAAGLQASIRVQRADAGGQGQDEWLPRRKLIGGSRVQPRKDPTVMGPDETSSRAKRLRAALVKDHVPVLA